jgi:hypothetical protein
MDVNDIRAEWETSHMLGPSSVHWLREHGAPGDPHPILTAVDALRRAETPPAALD